MIRRLAVLLAMLPFAGMAQDLDYVGSETCTGCHQAAAAAWEGSHHALAWTEPGPDTVLADFDGTVFAHDGMTVRFRIEGDDYFAAVTEKDGGVTDYRLHSVVGVAPLQQYLFETDGGRLQSFDVTWDTEHGEWFHLYPDQDLPPDDGLHWTGPYKNWYARCAECHATGFRRNYGSRTGTYQSEQAEIGVGCEACHGPGSAHIEWANGGEPSADLQPVGLPMTFGKDTTTEQATQQCAGCHSRREALADGNPVPGTNYHDAFTLALLRPGLYHPDGQILDEVYVYGSFLQSRMYAQGVGCMDCHEPHGATLRAEGNGLCTQCHSLAGNPEFQSLKLAEYDDPAHHNHPQDSAGAQCKNCHMIERNFMQVDGRRDHSFRIPRPDLGAQTGGPDACSDCHSDQDQDWAAAWLEVWYPGLATRHPHYGPVLARGQAEPELAAADLRELALDRDQPAIIRATALYLLQPVASPDLAEDVAPLLAHPDPLIRGSAAVLQRAAPASERITRLMPVLQDRRRTVRIAAAKQVFDTPVQSLSRSQAAVIREAVTDWQRSLASRLDFPETHLVMGGMALTLRNTPAAIGAFRQVVTMDPQRGEAWSMLVRLTEIEEGPQAARQVLRDALLHLPEDPGLRALARDLRP
ncbi:MAG: multiheme c-type cytochrome [Pseudomonadota bacterium]